MRPNVRGRSRRPSLCVDVQGIVTPALMLVFIPMRCQLGPPNWERLLIVFRRRPRGTAVYADTRPLRARLFRRGALRAARVRVSDAGGRHALQPPGMTERDPPGEDSRAGLGVGAARRRRSIDPHLPRSEYDWLVREIERELRTDADAETLASVMTDAVRQRYGLQNPPPADDVASRLLALGKQR
jgi:hypothetical protein